MKVAWTARTGDGEDGGGINGTGYRMSLSSEESGKPVLYSWL